MPGAARRRKHERRHESAGSATGWSDPIDVTIQGTSFSYVTIDNEIVQGTIDGDTITGTTQLHACCGKDTIGFQANAVNASQFAGTWKDAMPSNAGGKDPGRACVSGCCAPGTNCCSTGCC